MHRGRLSYATPAAENPALLCLKKLTAKQEGSSRNGAGDMRHGHSETYRWQSSIQEGDTFHLQHNLLLFIQNTATTTHPYKQEDRTVCVHVCIRWLVNYRTRWAIVLELLMQMWDRTRRRQSHWLARDQTHSSPSWSPWETTPATAASLFTTEYVIWVRGHRAGSGDVMRLDTRRKGSNRMGDEDRRRYNDQVLTDGPFGP